MLKDTIYVYTLYVEGYNILHTLYVEAYNVRHTSNVNGYTQRQELNYGTIILYSSVPPLSSLGRSSLIRLVAAKMP